MTRRFILFALCYCAALAAGARTTVVVSVVQPVAAGSDVTPPTITSITVATNGTTWTVGLDEATSVGAGGSGGLEVWMEFVGKVTLTYSSGDGTTSLVYTGSPAVLSGEPASDGVNYTQPGDGLEDGAGNDLATVSDVAVTNNSTVTPLVWQNFEGTNYDNSENWTEVTATDGTVDEDYTTSPLAGSQSLRLSEGTGGDVQAWFEWATGSGAVNGMITFEVESWDGGTLTARTIAFFSPTGSSTALGSVRANFTATTIAPLARIGTTNGTAMTDTFTHGTKVWLWWDYNNTTDVVNVYCSTTSKKPDSGSSGHSSVTATVSTAAQRIYLVEDEPGSSFKFDRVIVW